MIKTVVLLKLFSKCELKKWDQNVSRAKISVFSKISETMVYCSVKRR